MLASLKKDPPASKPFMARVTTDGKTEFAAVYRELNVIVSRGSDEAVDAAALKLAALGIDVPGVVGPPREAERFSSAWARERGYANFLAVDQRIYLLTEVRRPATVPGSMRPITPADLDLVAEWAFGFDREALPHETHTREDTRRRIERRIRNGDLFGWDVDGPLASMAGLARPTRRTLCLNAVYTPPPNRRRGYATALVAALSQEGLKRGKEACVLYSDLGNPTSNSIYTKLGYRPVCDSRNYRFRPL